MGQVPFFTPNYICFMFMTYKIWFAIVSFLGIADIIMNTMMVKNACAQQVHWFWSQVTRLQILLDIHNY